MASSQYFNHFNSPAEQRLIDNLVTESIKVYGHDVLYLPRTIVNRDSIFNEPEYSSFNQAILIEMYIRNVDDFAGEGELLSKFGMEIRDQITLVVSQRTFGEEIGTQISQPRPEEGDLIFMPMTNAAYQIQYVNPKAIFYQMGALQTYDLTCELFEYSDEIFNTGYPVIDDKYNAFKTDLSGYQILDSTNTYILTATSGERLVHTDHSIIELDPQAQNDQLQDTADAILDFTELNPWGEP